MCAGFMHINASTYVCVCVFVLVAVTLTSRPSLPAGLLLPHHCISTAGLMYMHRDRTRAGPQTERAPEELHDINGKSQS